MQTTTADQIVNANNDSDPDTTAMRRVVHKRWRLYHSSHRLTKGEKMIDTPNIQVDWRGRQVQRIKADARNVGADSDTRIVEQRACRHTVNKVNGSRFLLQTVWNLLIPSVN